MFVEGKSAMFHGHPTVMQQLQELMTQQSKRICLEVELPETELAIRRIRFYERNGLYLNSYDYIITECRKQITNVQTGIFGADMKISLTNDGPFTIILDSEDLA